MPQFYVYIYRDPSRRNEPIYVGKGQDDRAYEHLKRARSPHFKNRLAKMKANGIDPIINVVDLPSEALAFQCEVDAIARFGRKDLKLGPLLNQTDGGEGPSGRVASPETRQKNSDAMKGEKNPNYGKSPSLESRKKQSEAMKGEKHPMYGKSPSAETRAKQSDAHKGQPSPNKGKTASLETRKKQSEVHKGRILPKSVCPHCGILTGPSRWHFDNCKYKK